MLLVNGVTGSIGRSVLKLATSRGIPTCGVGRNPSKLSALRDEFPHSHFFSVHDVADELEAIKTISDLQDRHGDITMYLHAAAFLRRSASPVQTELADFQEAIRTNLEGTFIWNKQILSHMISRGVHGVILNMSSQAARTGGFGSNVAYATSKGGVETLTKSFARYGAEFGIRVNAISPGFVDNEMMVDGLNPSQREFFVNKTLLKRFANNEEVAKVCLFLLSDESSYITAEVLEVSAGQKIG